MMPTRALRPGRAGADAYVRLGTKFTPGMPDMPPAELYVPVLDEAASGRTCATAALASSRPGRPYQKTVRSPDEYVPVQRLKNQACGAFCQGRRHTARGEGCATA